MNIAKPVLGDEEKDAVSRVLDSGMLAQGKEVARFEEEFAELIGVEHAVATSSGTTAIRVALEALDVGPGDEVITTPFTFIATATPIIDLGARPVFCDIDPRTFNIDAEKVTELITERTKGILPVHLYGLPADMGPLKEIARSRGLFLLEDAAQAHGAEYEGAKVGGLGSAGCFSFYPTKNMTTGEGGMVTTNDAGLYERMKLIRNHGQSGRYEYSRIGYNFRMTDIEAALGRVQLSHLEGWNEKRRSNARLYDELLSDIVEIPHVPPDRTHVYHQYTIKTDGRDELRGHLAGSGVGTGVYYPEPLYRIAALKVECRPLPNAEECSKKVLSLPVHPSLTEDDIRFVSERTAEFIRR